ncbi:MAG: Ig-like domain-containing protein, partial [Pirellulaceae bacterium]
FTFSGGGFDLDSIEFDEPIQSAYVNRVVAAAGTTRIELEEFDVGGEGIAYSDMTIGNQASSAFRTDENVDTNGDIITNDIEAGEWLEYTTDIEAGVYDITLHKSWGAPGKQVRLLIADQNSATEFEELGVFESTTGDGGENIVLPAVSLSAWAGTERVIRVEMLSSSFGINWLDFAFTNAAQTAYVDRTIAAGSPTVVELEQFDLGGEGIAYSDSSPGNNASDTFRADEDVDTNGSLLTNDVVDGEWLEYTTNIEAGQYDITLNKNWSAGDAAVKLLVGASNSSSELLELGQFEFGAGGQENITLSEIDLSDHAGVERVIRIEVIGSWMGLDSLIFTPAEADSEPPTADIVDVSPDPRNSNAGLVTILFDEVVSGVDLSDFRLTRDGEAVDLSNAVLTPVSGSEYQVDLSAATDADGLYVLTLENQGSGIADLAGNALAANAVDEFLVDLSGPQVESVVVNDGSVQRSMVSKLTVTFSEEVVGLDASSFVLINTTTNAQITPIIDTHVISGRTVATLTFAGDGIIGGSLADGNYTLTTLSSALTDSAGNHLDGDEDGESGGDATDEFFRLFGDGNGDRRVNIIDFFGFRRAIRGEYNAAYDFDGDGRVNIIDFFRFRSRFGKSL